MNEPYDLLVLGAGPGGYSAAFRAADLGMRVALVERGPTLGGVCLNVGCIPSKALLHVAAVLEEAVHLAGVGVEFARPQIDLAKLRAHRSQVVGKLTSGLAAMAKLRKVDVLRGSGRFADAHTLFWTAAEGGESRDIGFRQAIIAAGSEPVALPFLPQDPRIVDSTGALELPFVPKRMLVIGGGIIGLEMATVYSALGARVDVVELTAGLMPGTDRDLVKVWHKRNEHRFDRVLLQTRAAAVDALPEAVRVRFEGEQAPEGAIDYDLVLVSAGRRPNGKAIGAEAAGVQVDERGFIPADAQMRTNVAHIFAIGDIAGGPMLAHKAVHEGHVAAEVAAGYKAAFDARVIPSVAYTDPEIAWAGLTETEAKAKGIEVTVSRFPWAASGRAVAIGRTDGLTKVIAEKGSGRVLGWGITGAGAGEMIAEGVLAIEMGAVAEDVALTIHPHPTLSETVMEAAEGIVGHATHYYGR